jgi:acyl carrier protein
MATEAAAYEALREIFSDVFLRDDIVLGPKLAAADVEGWDSFKQLEIVMACEERFAITFTTRELDELLCLGDVVALIMAKTN